MNSNDLTNRKEHESYGMIGVYQTFGGEKSLFGSSIKHNDVITISIKAGRVTRSLNEDMYTGGREYIRLEMSHAQFSQMITSINHGDGVPCTIQHLMGEKMPPCPFENKAELHKKEFDMHQEEIKQKMQNLIEFAKSSFDKSSVKKSDRETILRMLENLKSDVTVNSAFQVAQFDRQMEHTVTEAKQEIEAFLKIKGIDTNADPRLTDGDK